MAPPATVSFGFVVLRALAARDAAAIDRVMTPAARTRVAALLARPTDPITALILAGKHGIKGRRDAGRALVRFGKLPSGQAAVLVLAIDPAIGFVLDGIEAMADCDFEFFGVEDKPPNLVIG